MQSDIQRLKCFPEYSACRSYPCANNATCLINSAGFTCICPSGYNGTYCENIVAPPILCSTTDSRCLI